MSILSPSLRRQIPIAIALLAVGFLVLYPIGTVFWLTFAGGSTVSGTIPWQEAFNTPGLVTSILNTLKVVAATQIIALPIALVIAWLLARTDLPGARWIEFGFWVLFFLPSMGVMTGWLLCFDPDFGLANRWLSAIGLDRLAGFDLYSFGGIVFIHVATYGIAVKVMLLTPAFRNLDASIEEASALCGANRIKTLLRIVLPIMTPAILVVVLMSIIRGFETFEVELILGTPIRFQVFSTKIYQLMHNSPPEFRAAGTLGTSILAIILPLIVLQRWASTRRSFTTVTGRIARGKAKLGAWRWPACIALIGVVAFFSLLPFGLLVMGSFMTMFGFFDVAEVWTIAQWSKAFEDTTLLSSLSNTLYLGIGTALLATIVYVAVAYCIVRPKSRLRAPLDFLTWLPFTVPGIILGFGYLNMALRVPIFSPLYGTIGALILVSILSAMPLGVQVLKNHMMQVGAEIEEAGRVAGASWIQGFRRILLPLASPTLAIVAIMVFASTIRGVSNLMLLSSGSNRVLAVLQVEYLSEGNFGPAAVIGTMIVLMSLVAAVIVRLVSLRYEIASRS